MKNASISRPLATLKTSANPHGYSLLAGHLAACCVLLGVTGCATAPPAPPQKVEVPVLVSCVDASKVPLAPVFKFSALGPAATGGDKVLALADDWLTGRTYEGQLEAIIAGCR